MNKGGPPVNVGYINKPQYGSSAEEDENVATVVHRSQQQQQRQRQRIFGGLMNNDGGGEFIEDAAGPSSADSLSDSLNDINLSGGVDSADIQMADTRNPRFLHFLQANIK